MNNHNIANSDFAAKILAWYDEHARTLPWRSLPGAVPDAYHVWLSEIMLQQTTVATVGPYFKKFLSNWPTVKDLAAAPLDDVLTAWAGLGYYARARNLHKCAVAVCHNYGGQFPGNEADLLTLPGIGSYTAAAVASIAFGQPTTVVDGNIERIISRVFRIQDEIPKSRKEIGIKAASLTPKKRAGDYAQALMDIGATVCTPKNAKCDQCPVASQCAGFKEGDFALYPKKSPKKVKPTRRAAVFWIENEAGEILMRRREETGLLGGMMEFPSTPWVDTPHSQDCLQNLLTEFGLGELMIPQKSEELVKHTFTHFHLELSPLIVHLDLGRRVMSNEIHWVSPTRFDEIAIPTLMIKVVKAVQSGQIALPV